MYVISDLCFLLFLFFSSLLNKSLQLKRNVLACRDISVGYAVAVALVSRSVS